MTYHVVVTTYVSDNVNCHQLPSTKDLYAFTMFNQHNIQIENYRLLPLEKWDDVLASGARREEG